MAPGLGPVVLSNRLSTLKNCHPERSEGPAFQCGVNARDLLLTYLIEIGSTHMKPLLLALTLSLSFSALAADGKSVSYKSGDDTVPGMLYTPAGKGPFPALIVIHEWWGLNEWVKEQASKFADQGLVRRRRRVSAEHRQLCRRPDWQAEHQGVLAGGALARRHDLQPHRAHRFL